MRHQGVEEARGGALADRLGRLGREAEARQGRDYQIKGVGRIAAEPGWESQLLNGTPELEVRSRPTVCDQQGPFAARFSNYLQEVQVEILDLGSKLRKAIEIGHGGQPIKPIGPVGAEILQIASIATMGPTVVDLRRRRPGIVSNLV